MTYVKLGAVRAFPGARPDKAQALKVLEEAAETVEAFKQHREALDYDPDAVFTEPSRQFLLAEIADTVQACANLAAALGVTDLTPYMAECDERNRARGHSMSVGNVGR